MSCLAEDRRLGRQDREPDTTDRCTLEGFGQVEDWLGKLPWYWHARAPKQAQQMPYHCFQTTSARETAARHAAACGTCGSVGVCCRVGPSRARARPTWINRFHKHSAWALRTSACMESMSITVTLASTLQSITARSQKSTPACDLIYPRLQRFPLPYDQKPSDLKDRHCPA